MNGSEAMHAAILECLAAQRSFLDDALEEARTGKKFRAEFRAEQERGRTLPPITLGGESGDAPQGRSLFAR